MSAVAAATCAGVGGSAAMCRSVIRTQPMSTLVRCVGCPDPSTNSVDPPPMSTTRKGARAPAGMPVVAPANDSAPSSAPLMTSGSTPRMSRTPATNSARLDTSREAEVATNRSGGLPASRSRSA